MIIKQKSTNEYKTLAILVGGGPAPGINGVISAATIEARNRGMKIVGILDGFKWLAWGDKTKIVDLHIDNVSREHFRGGSILRTSRENPSINPEKIENVLRVIHELKIDYLLTIGGDDTLNTAIKLGKLSNGTFRIAHAPKTIDNDLPLPGNVSTFGFQTARDWGVKLVENIMEDSKTTGRWYFVVAMGRRTGHLALGICKASDATLTIIPEEFKDKEIRLSNICDILEGSIIKRLANGRNHGVAILAEGLALKLNKDELKDLKDIERDKSGNVRLSKVALGKVLRNEVEKKLSKIGLDITIVDKDIGYELRCAPPIPFDIEYTRNIGYGAVKFLTNGGTKAMISIVDGKMNPLDFKGLLDPATGKPRIRLVNVNTESYETARKFMIRLNKEDFEDEAVTADLARTATLTANEFAKRYSYLLNIDKFYSLPKGDLNSS